MTIAPFGQMDVHAPQPVHSALIFRTVCLIPCTFLPVFCAVWPRHARLSAMTACTVSRFPAV